MPKCASCGSETDLRELDVPICPACIAERDQPWLAGLNAGLITAREAYRKALADYEHHQARCRDLPKGHSERMTGAGLEHAAKTAGERYWQALRLYGSALRQEGGH